MKQQRDSKKRIALVQRFAEGHAAPEEIQVVPTGKWDHPAYGEMEITSADIARFVENFKAKVRKDLPITAGHDNGMNGGELNAIGWFTELIDRGVNGLWGAVKWTSEGTDLLSKGAFKYFSPEFYEQYSDPETGAKYEHVLVGGALTNKPYFKELEPVMAFSEPDIMNQSINSDMDINTILAKGAADRTPEELAFLSTATLSDEQKAQVAAETATGKTDEEKAAEEKTAADKAAADAAAEAEAQRQLSEKGKKIVMSEGEHKLLTEKADQGAKAFAELALMKSEKFADKFIFSETNKDGRFLPKQKDALAKFFHELTQTQRDQFQTLVNALPKQTLSFKEIGEGGATEGSVVQEMEVAVQKKMSETKLAYSAASKLVFKENPELGKRYTAHVTGADAE